MRSAFKCILDARSHSRPPKAAIAHDTKFLHHKQACAHTHTHTYTHRSAQRLQARKGTNPPEELPGALS